MSSGEPVAIPGSGEVSFREKRWGPAPRWVRETLKKTVSVVGSILIAGGIVAAYEAALDAPFLWDDQDSVLENPGIRTLLPLSGPCSDPSALSHPLNNRPVPSLTLALNFHFFGYDVRPYRVTNMVIHWACSILIWAILRMMLRSPSLRARFGRDSNLLGFLAAIIWALHPINSEPVIYITQRTTILMSFFLLLSLYCSQRSWTSLRSGGWWAVGASLACAAGMGSKEVMVSAPLLILLFDRTFYSGSARTSWAAHRFLYLGLAGSWFVLAALLMTGAAQEGAAGFRLGISVWEYLTIQARMIVRYVGLVIWPGRLMASYVAVPPSPAEYLLPGSALVAALCGSLWAIHRRHPIGMAGAWFFLILAPTSSVLPIASQVAAERRMYLPSLALIVLVIVLAQIPLSRLSRSSVSSLNLGVAAVLIIVLGISTSLRSAIWSTETSLWKDNVAKDPSNQLARNNLGQVLLSAGDAGSAKEHFETALRLDPDYPEALHNLALCHLEEGRIVEARHLLERALALRPRNAVTHLVLARVLSMEGRRKECWSHLAKAESLEPSAKTHCIVAGFHILEGQSEEARIHLQEALRLDPTFEEARNRLAELELSMQEGPASPR